jgi:hypothetical protein
VKARQEEMVPNVQAAAKFGLVILGGSHDLTTVVPGHCEYVRVWTGWWPNLGDKKQPG